MTNLDPGLPPAARIVRFDRGHGTADGREWDGRVWPPDALALRHRLVLRFALANMIAVSLFTAAYLQGWIAAIFAADATRLSLVIFGVFVVGLWLSGHRLWHTSRELDEARRRRPRDSSHVRRYLSAIRGREAASRAIAAASLRLRLTGRIGMVRTLGSCLVVLGLIGTVIGFIIALAGVDAGAVAEPSAIAPMVSAVIGGMSVALYTTLVGAVLSIWLTVNFAILTSGTIELITEIIDRGEDDAED